MMNESTPAPFVLCFRALFGAGRAFAFPCDARGVVDLDGLSDQGRTDYLYARAMVGRELQAPAIEPGRP